MNKPVRQFLTAGDADQRVPAKSIFTPLFIRALEGAADYTKDGYVTGSELGLYLKQNLSQYTKNQTPQFGTIRDPDLDQGDIVFRDLNASRFVATNLPRPTVNPSPVKINSNRSQPSPNPVTTPQSQPTPKPTPSPEINVATLTPPQETKTKNSSSSQDITSRDFSILQKVLVFVIADDSGALLVAIDNNKKLTGIFISQQDAQKFFEKLKKEKPDIAAKVKVNPISLAEIYKQAVANKNKPDSERIDFAYIPVPSEVESATQLLATSGKKYEGGVPVYAARGGKDNGYLTIQQNNEQVIPFFFERKEIEEMVNRFKREKPDLASTVTIEVNPLENLLSALQKSNDPQLGKIRFVPSEESVKFIQSLKKNN
jgi:hypothetical protein